MVPSTGETNVARPRPLASWTPLAPIACALVACAHRPPPTEHFAKLSVHQSALAGVIPRVHTLIAGHPLTMLVDTGAYQSILPWGFAKKHGLTAKARSTGELMV